LSYLVNTQTDRQTDKLWQKHNLLGGGNYDSNLIIYVIIITGNLYFFKQLFVVFILVQCPTYTFISRTCMQVTSHRSDIHQKLIADDLHATSIQTGKKSS